MAIPVWNRIFTNTLATVSLFGSFTIIKINKTRVAAADDEFHIPVPERGTPWNSNWDRDEPSPRPIVCEHNGSSDCAQEIPSTAIRNIFLIRHAQYKTFGGHLTEKGKTQSLKTAERLQQLGYTYHPVIATSESKRAVETCSEIRKLHPNLSIRQFENLNEGYPIHPEPMLKIPLEDTASDEKIERDGSRLEDAFHDFFYRAKPEQERDSYELIVSHSNILRYFVCRALQFPPEAWNRLSMHNCSITWIVIYPNGDVELKAFGDAEHLPNKLLTTSG